MGEIRRIAIVDDDAGVRDSIAQLIKGRPRLMRLVAECARAKDALARLPELNVDLALLDIRMPGMDGIECCYELRKMMPEVAVAMFTSRPVTECFEPALQAGADGYFVKGLDGGDLLKALRNIKREKHQCLCASPMVTRKYIHQHEPRSPLTPCDEAILSLALEGLTIKEIADARNCHEQTVKKHLLASRTKLGAKTLAQALVLWQRLLLGGTKVALGKPNCFASILHQ